MMTLGAIGFLQPWMLLGLAALPAIWWLLRLTPPSPQHVVFPPTRLLKDLKSTEETPAHSPWWLTALRVLLAGLIVLALARPVLNPDRQSFAGTGPILLVVDNGWASAAHWPERREAIDAALDRATRGGRTVVLAPSAPGDPLIGPLSAEQARERAAGLVPHPYAPDRKALVETLQGELGAKTDYSVVWLSDGLDYGEGQTFVDGLAKLAGKTGSVTTLRPEANDAALALDQSAGERSGLTARVSSGTEGPRSGVIRAVTGRGEPLGEAPFTLAKGKRETKAQFDLPLEIRNQVARIEIGGERSAGAVYLLDARSEWHRVGIISGESREAAQPLLSPLYYVQRALSPYADVVTPAEGNVSTSVHELIDGKVSTIVLADIGKLVPGTEEELEHWLKAGGVLIRFAGPRLEQGGDELLPVALRRGGRSLGGSLSWSTPQPLAPFEEASPFHGLVLPNDVKINRQVLADPTIATDSQVWARLADGTPLVTASRMGQGWIVLFHVTANSDWSNLPLSGLFVEMLRRTVNMGPSKVDVGSEGQAEAASGPAKAPASLGAAAASALPPIQTLDGYGQLSSPPARAVPISPDQIDTNQPSPEHPPGYYGSSSAARAFNVMSTKTVLKPLKP
ncbi:MAG TPA: BatA domain-containing protein, partial [Methyloceanibacter sp.]|nr:BatA domain-containing protein [Methyloceanibacter sp.]